MSDSTLFRSLPKVDALARDPALAGVPFPIAVAAARDAIDAARDRLRAGGGAGDLVADAARRARALDQGRLTQVINATGVVLHTNLGRAPWSDSALAAAQRVASGCDLELTLSDGRRGGRLAGVSAQLRHLVGAEAALVVNNNAAAVLLALTALAAGREVVVSRGELVEIGGSFRVPDIIASGGARLVEVGTTNRTRIADVRAAAGPDTALLLKVHRSNFKVVGFTEEPTRQELAAVGRELGVPLVEDLGSGSLRGGHGEPSVREVLEAGVDLCTFSGDKLVGGPQSGVVVGRAELVARLRSHPLYRAMRVGKVTLAALEATLGDHLAGRVTPVDRMLTTTADELLARAQRLQVASDVGEVVATDGQVGGGAVPGETLASFALRVATSQPDALATALRTGTPAVLARVHRDALLLDVRTVPDERIPALAERLAALCRSE
ncbi:MAG: L-seryl-tRNA(Sec) selenium transferase [Alphaproteobacteria bacterium]|nr:L-seryl-tRNA(Sec) selenium transferase [Alphaproteobacteria bacterium]